MTNMKLTNLEHKLPKKLATTNNVGNMEVTWTMLQKVLSELITHTHIKYNTTLTTLN